MGTSNSPMTQFLSFFKSFTNLAWVAVVVLLFAACTTKHQSINGVIIKHDTIILDGKTITAKIDSAEPAAIKIDSNIAYLKYSRKTHEWAVYAQDYDWESGRRWGYLKYGVMSRDNLFTSFNDEDFLTFKDKQEALEIALKYTKSYMQYRIDQAAKEKTVHTKNQNFR